MIFFGGCLMCDEAPLKFTRTHTHTAQWCLHRTPPSTTGTRHDIEKLDASDYEGQAQGPTGATTARTRPGGHAMALRLMAAQRKFQVAESEAQYVA